jgi:hypothetical protein
MAPVLLQRMAVPRAPSRARVPQVITLSGVINSQLPALASGFASCVQMYLLMELNGFLQPLLGPVLYSSVSDSRLDWILKKASSFQNFL